MFDSIKAHSLTCCVSESDLNSKDFPSIAPSEDSGRVFRAALLRKSLVIVDPSCVQRSLPLSRKAAPTLPNILGSRKDLQFQCRTWEAVSSSMDCCGALLAFTPF